MSHENVPLVLPDWLEPSEVSAIANRVGVVKHRGETVDCRADVGGVSVIACAPGGFECPNSPRCEHPAYVHDIDTYEEPRPICCADGCSCGRSTGGVQ